MATVPSASTSVQTTAAAAVAGLDTICILAPVPNQADITPRQYGSPDAVFAVHGFSEGVDYCSFHTQETRKPYIFVGLPIDVLGTVGRFDTSGNTGGSVASVATGSDGSLTEHEGAVRVAGTATVTVGTDQVAIEYTLDGGLLWQKVRVGTATSYAIPNSGVTVSFTVGTLVGGDTVITWSGTGPRASVTDIALAREALAAQLKFFRSILVVGDMQSDTEAGAVRDELNAYETENERFVYGRLSVLDRLPLAALSTGTSGHMVAGTSLTFATAGDTITRATGSWIADGFAVGDTYTITGATASAGANNITGVITVLTPTVLTTSSNLTDETTVNAAISGRATLTFSNTGETITRNRGSWLADGFRVGDSVTTLGSDGGTNDGTFAATVVTALVLTLAAGAIDADEVSPVTQVSVTAGQTKAEWMAEVDAEFASIDGEPRVDLSAGRARKASPFTGWNLRRPASWVASLREYQHDLHVATWRKKDGPTGWTLNDADGNLAEWDDRVDGGAASAARFTSLRTWSNGPAGCFVTLSLTRELEQELTSRTHNAAVVNLACGIVQLNTELVIGVSLTLNDDGTATDDSLSTIEMQVNSALAIGLLSSRGEGPRASKAVWSASRADVLNVPEAEITGVLDLNLNGTVHKVTTKVRVRTGGA